MSKKPRLGGLFGKQHDKHAEPLLKSAWHYLYHTHWSLPNQLSWKKYLFLTCQILGLLVNILAADGKYPLVKRDNLTMPIQMHLRRKRNNFSQFFTAFLKCSWNFEHFDKKDDAHRFCISEITDSKTQSDQCLKSPVSEDPSTCNMVKVLKHSWNLHYSTFILLIDHC